MLASPDGRSAFSHRDATFPGVSLPSNVVRSTIETAVRRPQSLEAFFDAASGIFGDALFDADAIDRADFVEQAPENDADDPAFMRGRGACGSPPAKQQRENLDRRGPLVTPFIQGRLREILPRRLLDAHAPEDLREKTLVRVDSSARPAAAGGRHLGQVVVRRHQLRPDRLHETHHSRGRRRLREPAGFYDLKARCPSRRGISRNGPTRPAGTS